MTMDGIERCEFDGRGTRCRNRSKWIAFHPRYPLGAYTCTMHLPFYRRQGLTDVREITPETRGEEG